MSSKTQLHKQKYQRGLSLLELMISLTIGLILLLGLTQIYQIGNKASIESNNISALNDKARRIMYLLANDFQQAGYVDPFDENPNSPGDSNAAVLFDFNDDNIKNIYERLADTSGSTAAPVPLTTIEAIKGLVPIIGCPSHMSGTPSVATPTTGTPLMAGLAPSVNVPTCNASAGSQTQQSLQISYQAISSTPTTTPQPLRSLLTDGDENTRRSGAAQDCLGGNINPATENGYVSNRYFLDGSEFKCIGSASAAAGAQTLADDVNEFVVKYRITSGTTDPTGASPTISGEETAQFITAAQLHVPTNLPLGWASITGAQVCLVMAGSPLDGRNQNVNDIQPLIPSCVGNGSKARPAGDNRYYKRFVSTFSLPNMLYNIPSP